MNSCCYHLPAFHILDPNIAYYKQNLNNLDVASQVSLYVHLSPRNRSSFFALHRSLSESSLLSVLELRLTALYWALLDRTSRMEKPLTSWCCLLESEGRTLGEQSSNKQRNYVRKSKLCKWPRSSTLKHSLRSFRCSCVSPVILRSRQLELNSFAYSLDSFGSETENRSILPTSSNWTLLRYAKRRTAATRSRSHQTICRSYSFRIRCSNWRLA